MTAAQRYAPSALYTPTGPAACYKDDDSQIHLQASMPWQAT